MGAAPSTNPTRGKLSHKPSISQAKDRKSLEELVHFLQPIYFINAPLNPEEKKALTASWRSIIFNKPREFERVKEVHLDAGICNSLPEYFAKRFFSRFVEVHPVSGPMFSKTSEKQGRLFMNMITLIVNAEEEGNDNKMTGALLALVKSHCPMGIRAVEYSVFGEALFWTLKHVLGVETYNISTHKAWVKLYSKMLAIILPAALNYELENEMNVQNMQFSRLKTNCLSDECDTVKSVTGLDTPTFSRR